MREPDARNDYPRDQRSGTDSEQRHHGFLDQRSPGAWAGTRLARSGKTMEPARPKAMVPLLSYQQAELEAEDRFRWSCWSRQVGKSFVKSLRRIVRGVRRGRDQLLISGGERQSRELMRKVKQHCRALNLVAEYRGLGGLGARVSKQMEVHLPNRVRVIALPANPDTVRGFSGDVFLDEFAMHPDDTAIWAAVFPTVLRDEGELDIASTPKGRGNLFYRLRENRMFRHSTVTLPQAIEAGLKVNPAEVRQALGDEALFRQEFLCEFLGEGLALLGYEMITACEDPRLSKEPDAEILSRGSTEVYAGVDVGRRRDLTVIWLLQRVEEKYVTRGVLEMSGRPFREQFEVISKILSAPALQRCCMDAGGLGMQLSEMAVETFGEHRVEAVTLTRAIKESLAGRLRILVEEGSIRIPSDESIRRDWHSIRRMVTETGHVRLEADRLTSGHGDRFWAAALAVQAAGQPAGKIEFVGAGRLAFSRDGVW